MKFIIYVAALAATVLGAKLTQEGSSALQAEPVEAMLSENKIDHEEEDSHDEEDALAQADASLDDEATLNEDSLAQTQRSKKDRIAERKAIRKAGRVRRRCLNRVEKSFKSRERKAEMTAACHSEYAKSVADAKEEYA